MLRKQPTFAGPIRLRTIAAAAPSARPLTAAVQRAATSTPAPAAALQTTEWLAAYLRISAKHIRCELRAGRFPLAPVKFGRAVRWNVAAVDAWIAAGCPAKTTAAPRKEDGDGNPV